MAIVDGIPAGLQIDLDAVTTQLRRRQSGYGRGRRMQIESDRAEPLGGIRRGETTGGPIALLIPNRDWENWQRTMHVERETPAGATGIDRPPVTRPRPGHADLAGFVKYGHDDMIVAGSAIFHTADPEQATRELKKAALGALAPSTGIAG